MKEISSNDSHYLKSVYNQDFFDSEAGRPLRILAEYLDPLDRLQKEKIQDTVVFYGSARLPPDHPTLGRYYEDARQLAFILTQWSNTLPGDKRFVICSGGGGGIMEAANRGASEAGGRTIGFNIGLPYEQRPNSYISPELVFEFHYFFMRKLWFSHLAQALVVFPGGFGTLDELTDILTLAQTGKIRRKITILLYGSDYWKEVFNFDVLLRHGMINKSDLDLFDYVDDVQSAFEILKQRLPQKSAMSSPAIAKSRTCQDKN